MNLIAKLVFVHPEGYLDEEREQEDFDYPQSRKFRVESYELRHLASYPQIKDLFSSPMWGITDWQAVEIHRYTPLTPTSICYCEVVCTQDGDVPTRADWSDSNKHICSFELENGFLIEEEPGYAVFSLSSQVRRKGNPILFMPEDERPVQGFDLVAIYNTSISSERTIAEVA